MKRVTEHRQGIARAQDSGPLGSEAHHQNNSEREQNRGKANGKRECDRHGIPLCDKDALWRVNE